MATTKNEYIPGVCNIGPAEIKRRRQAGLFGLGATIILWVTFGLLHVSAPWRLLLFFPATISASGFLQAAMHFCAGFGRLGFFNFGPEVGKTENVVQAEFRKKDRQKAGLIGFYAMLIGIVVAIAGLLIA